MSRKDQVFEGWYQQHYTFLLLLCRRKTGYDPLYADLIESCIQETFLLAYRHYDELQRMESIRGWLVRTCMNRLAPYAQLLRKRLSHEAYSLDDEHAPEPPAPGEPSQLMEKISALEERLSPQQQEVLRIHFLEGHSLEETAEQANISLASAKTTVSRIRQKAKKVLQDDLFSPD